MRFAEATGFKLQATGETRFLQPAAYSLQLVSQLAAYSLQQLARLTASVIAWLSAPAASWAFGSGVRVWLPESVTTTAPEIDRLFYAVLWITGAIFVLVQGTLLVFLVLYRRREGRQAGYIHGNQLVEIIWTVIPAGILIFLATYSQRVWSQVRGSPPPPDLQVEITAQQFAWNIHYPGADGKFGRTDPKLVDDAAANYIGLDRSDPPARDDLVTQNQLHLPVGKTVLIHLKSKDVIHSFFVPQFRMKLDAVPGITGHLWLSATKAGHYEIACAELCGLGHYRMRGFLVIESPEEFQAWLSQTLAEQAS